VILSFVQRPHIDDDPEHFIMPRRWNDCIVPLAPPWIIANIPWSVSTCL